MTTGIFIIAAIIYSIGAIATLIIGIYELFDAKDDRERGYLPKPRIDQKSSQALRLIKGGFIVWPLIAAHNISHAIREEERQHDDH